MRLLARHMDIDLSIQIPDEEIYDLQEAEDGGYFHEWAETKLWDTIASLSSAEEWTVVVDD